MRSDLISEVRICGHMPKILPMSFWWMPLDWRKEIIYSMDCKEAEWRDGLRDIAFPESTPIISRHRIFSLNWRERFEFAG